MKIILTGGCTGGHIYPALAIGDKFKEKDPDCEMLYLGHEWGLETTIVPRAGYKLRIIRADWLRRDNPVRMLKTLHNTNAGAGQARRIMQKFKPDAVISTGSFVSVPVVLAALACKVPVYMHEQNGFPGVSNRTFSKKARKVFLGFESAREYFKDNDNIIYSGNPVRKDFYGRNRAEDRKALGFDDKDIVITVFGGSLGSTTTNEVGESLIREFGGKPGYRIVFGTGKTHFDEVANKLKDEGFDAFDNVSVKPYISDMPQVMSASDLLVSRSGALSVAEVTMAGRAAIFIPSPNVTADHQYYNAKAVADNGGAIIVREDDNTADTVMKEIRELVSDRNRISAMEKASAALAPVSAADIIYNTIMETYR